MAQPFDFQQHARALDRLAVSASAVAEGVQRELPGELARQAAVLAVDLGALARATRDAADKLKAALS